MENINAYFASKITFIRYLLVILISSISIGVLAEAQNPKSIDGSWVNSGGRDHQSAQNPRYTFEVTEAGEFDIRLESATANPCIDTVLYLLETNSLKDSNDDWEDSPQSPHSDCNYNSRIITSNLSNGIYTLVAGTYSSGQSGDFVISARSRSPNGSFNLEKSDPEENKSIGSKCSGQWKSSGGQKHNSSQNPKFDLIVEEKEKVTINLTSSVDTFLYLLNKDSLRVIEKNDDIRLGNYNSRIEQVLDPGDYVLVAATYGNNKTGDFDLIVTSTDGNSELKCSPGGEDEGEGGNSSQQPLSLGEDVTITWSSNSAERFYQSQETTESSNSVMFESSHPEFTVSPATGRVEYEHPGATVITAVQRVNGIRQTAQYTLTVVKADQEPLVIDNITKTFAPDLAFKPTVSGGRIENKQVTFEKGYDPDNIVSLDNDPTMLEITGTGRVLIRATKAGNVDYNDVSRFFWLTVNKAKPWIKIGKLNQGKVITNLSDGALNIDEVFDIEVKVEQGEGETTIEVNKDEFAFDYTNNTQQLFSPVKIQNSKIMAKKIGRASIKVSVPESAKYFVAEKQFVLEVRPNNVRFDSKNLVDNFIKKQCGESVDVDLMIDNKTLEQALQNTGSSDDILVFASSNSSVAQVNSQNGEVDLVGTGTATISATFFGDSELADSYNLTVNKVVQPIEFQKKDIRKIDGDEIFKNSIKNPIKGAQPDGSITYSIKKQDGTLFSINSSTGEVTLNRGLELPVTYSATIEAKKRGNDCYEAATASYKINLYNAVVKFPEPGETADKEYNIQFSSSGSTSSNNIKLYYTNTPAGKLNENSIVKPIRGSGYDNKIDISQGSYRWDTSGLPEGNYYIIARTADGTDTANVDCDLEGTKGCYIAENPLIIEHDHGLAMDCSAMFNYPGGYLKAPYQCNRETLALRGASGRVSFIGKQNNLKPEHHEENVFRVYPSQSNFLTVKQDGRNSFYYDGSRSGEGNFTQNMTISSRDDAFIGVDKNNNIALSYPKTSKTYIGNWSNDFKKYKALDSYAGSEKEDLINNGSVANLIYQLPLESSDFDDTVFKSFSDFAQGDLFTSVVTNKFAKAALTKEGRIKVWGLSTAGGVIFSGEHANRGFSYIDKIPDLNKTEFDEIYPGQVGFSAIKKDKSIIYWGFGQYVDPMNVNGSWVRVKSKIGDNFNKVFVNNFFYGVKSDGSVKVWSESFSNYLNLTNEIESVSDIKHIYTAELAVTLENKYGDLYWIPTDYYENPKPQEIEHPGFTKIYSNEKAFAGITAEGRIQSWGDNDCGGSNAPSDKGFIAIYSTYCSFVAVRADGTYRTWGKMGEKTGTLSPKTIMVTGTQKDVHNDQVEVSLEYNVSDGATNHQYLNVHMHYDSEKLTWIGFDTNTALGIHDKYKSPNNNILEKLNDYVFGELNLVGDYPVSGFISAGTDFGEINTDRLIYLKWGWNFNSRNRTFNVPLFSSEMGFTGNNQLPVALIKGYFVRKDGFDSGTTKITFTNAKPAEGNPSASYEFKSSSLIIEANPNTSNSDNAGG